MRSFHNITTSTSRIPFVFSFDIAIKSSRCLASSKSLDLNRKQDDLGALMDEAKSMLEIGSYNDNIVNLQGVTCKIERRTIQEVIMTRLTSKMI